MEVDEIKIWLLEWFKNNPEVDGEVELNEKDNYLESSWIDSLEFINFVADVEEHFNVRFTNEQFQDRHFGTVEGMAAIILGHLGNSDER